MNKQIIKGNHMWIFCCGMQRSGSTLQYQIVASLIENAGLGQRVEWVPPKEFYKVRGKYLTGAGMKVFKSHIYTDEIGMEFSKNNAKGVYIYRDLRDVMVSTMLKREKTFEELWEAGYLESCVNNNFKWTSLPNVLVSKYETVIENISAEVLMIARHLNIPFSSGKAAKLAADFSLEKQGERIQQAKKAKRTISIKDSGPVFDSHSLLHVDHIQYGGTRNWQAILNEDRVSLIENTYGDWLDEHGYKLSAPV